MNDGVLCDLILKLLVFDPLKRMSAITALMKHRFFDTLAPSFLKRKEPALRLLLQLHAAPSTTLLRTIKPTFSFPNNSFKSEHTPRGQAMGVVSFHTRSSPGVCSDVACSGVVCSRSILSTSPVTTKPMYSFVFD